MLTPTRPTIAESVIGQADDEIRELLDFLPVLYPGGADWLDRRLGEVRNGAACGSLVRSAERRVVGVMLGLLKANNRFKICTLYVDPAHRRNGLGAALLDVALDRARALGATTAYITGATSVRGELMPLLTSRSFARIATERNRYGEGRDEDVYSRPL